MKSITSSGAVVTHEVKENVSEVARKVNVSIGIQKFITLTLKDDKKIGIIADKVIGIKENG